MPFLFHFVFILLTERYDRQKTHDPGNTELEQYKENGKLSAFGFTTDRSNCCSTWNIQQTEYHQRQSIGSTESNTV